MGLFRSFRNAPPQSRASLLVDVRRQFAAMSDEDFEAFLLTLPEGVRADARAVRESKPAAEVRH
jgi:hypothetical protein